jgi:hypothetical protein
MFPHWEYVPCIGICEVERASCLVWLLCNCGVTRALTRRFALDFAEQSKPFGYSRNGGTFSARRY